MPALPHRRQNRFGTALQQEDQELCNLLNNAAKYTALGGRIELSMEIKKTSVCISVADNGIGMDAHLVPHVFELFTQAERTPDRSQGGLGLGLALVKSITMLHGGKVSTRSDGPGKGSVFTLTLPMLAGERASRSHSPADDLENQALQPLHILIVDDNADAAVSLAAVLRAQGHVVTVRTDAQSALEEVRVSRPEAFILDIGLPDMDGYELSRRLHGYPETRDAMYIALTGYGQAHDKVLAKAAGFQHYFVKPMEISSLQRVLSATARHHG